MLLFSQNTTPNISTRQDLSLDFSFYYDYKEDKGIYFLRTRYITLKITYR